MANLTLQPTVFEASALGRNNGVLRNTVIEDLPQISIRRAPPGRLQPRPDMMSPMSDDFPTPRANLSEPQSSCVQASPQTNSSEWESDQSSMWSKRSSNSDFDELYDLSGSDSEEVPIKLSSSIKKRIDKRDTAKTRYPSLVIPSPSQWPTIQKLQSAAALSPPLTVALSPAILSRLKEQKSRVPSTSSAPSLDGSLTSEELAASSCPSTPDPQESRGNRNSWEPPVQLDPSSINLLHQISSEEQQQQPGAVIEIPAEAMAEMREIVESPPLTGYFRLNTQSIPPRDPDEADDELSALSVPSPGGFFASLNSSVAKTWTLADQIPNTSTAAEFYGVPFRANSLTSEPIPPISASAAPSFYKSAWESRPDNPVEHVVSLASTATTQEPITARKVVLSPTDITEVAELDETYDEALKENAAANIDRTQLWLSAQDAYMQAVCEQDECDIDGLEKFEDLIPIAPPQQPLKQGSQSPSTVSPSKKSVRFAASSAEKASGNGSPNSVEAKRISPIHDGTFWQGWRHAKRSQRARDVFQHRQARAEAEHVKRTSLQRQHADQLYGKFVIAEAARPSPQRPISSLVAPEPEDEKTETIAKAHRERQALEQIQSSAWSLAAQKEFNGGRLLTSPVVQSFKRRSDVRILDLAGQVQCSWAWHVALEHPDASIYTTVSSDAEAHVAESCHEGPSNHFVVASPKLWELPFPDNHFDVVSGRALYSHLKLTWPKGKAADEWDLTLRECLRVLKPGGFFEFDLLDAELANAEPATQALGVEFAFNLKTRGFDPASGKNFLPRLRRAGFSDIKRAWMVLPMANVVPRWFDSGKPAGRDSGSSAVTPGNFMGDYHNADAVEQSNVTGATGPQYKAPLTGSTKDVRAMTGLIGARMWEQWMLKLNNEMGRSEKRCLDGIAQALEEGGRGTAGWRCLVGWARKEL